MKEMLIKESPIIPCFKSLLPFMFSYQNSITCNPFFTKPPIRSQFYIFLSPDLSVIYFIVFYLTKKIKNNKNNKKYCRRLQCSNYITFFYLLVWRRQKHQLIAYKHAENWYILTFFQHATIILSICSYELNTHIK